MIISLLKEYEEVCEAVERPATHISDQSLRLNRLDTTTLVPSIAATGVIVICLQGSKAVVVALDISWMFKFAVIWEISQLDEVQSTMVSCETLGGYIKMLLTPKFTLPLQVEFAHRHLSSPRCTRFLSKCYRFR
jgi:hypothetical protein